MKKAFPLFAAALAILASCNPEDKKPEEPTLSVAEKNVVLGSAGDSKTIVVEANKAWTAEVTSGQDWIRAEAKASELVISAPAWTTHQARMGAVTVKCETLSAVISVTQLAAPNTDKISVSPTSLNFEADGESKTVTVTANVTVKATPSETWITITPPATQSESMTYTLTATANTTSTARNASVTFSGGEADDVTIQVSQNPAASIEVDNNEVSATAEGGDFTVKVTSNVEWTASASENWVTVSPDKGQTTDIKISVGANDAAAARTANVTLAKGNKNVVIAVKQSGKEVPETLIAAWRCDNAEYVDSHSPDWSTSGANATSHGSGKGVALPETGAPEGTQMTWVRNDKTTTLDLVYITAAEGHFAVKAVLAGDGFMFTVPGQNFTKGQVISIDCALAAGANTVPKFWTAKFRTSASADWTVGEGASVKVDDTTNAFLQLTAMRVYDATARFKASYTVPENVSNATLQIFITSEGTTTMNGKVATNSTTMRMIPLYNADKTIEFQGPRITVK